MRSRAPQEWRSAPRALASTPSAGCAQSGCPALRGTENRRIQPRRRLGVSSSIHTPPIAPSSAEAISFSCQPAKGTRAKLCPLAPPPPCSEPVPCSERLLHVVESQKLFLHFLHAQKPGVAGVEFGQHIAVLLTGHNVFIVVQVDARRRARGKNRPYPQRACTLRWSAAFHTSFRHGGYQ